MTQQLDYSRRSYVYYVRRVVLLWAFGVTHWGKMSACDVETATNKLRRCHRGWLSRMFAAKYIDPRRLKTLYICTPATGAPLELSKQRVCARTAWCPQCYARRVGYLFFRIRKKCTNYPLTWQILTVTETVPVSESDRADVYINRLLQRRTAIAKRYHSVASGGFTHIRVSIQKDRCVLRLLVVLWFRKRGGEKWRKSVDKKLSEDAARSVELSGLAAVSRFLGYHLRYHPSIFAAPTGLAGNVLRAVRRAKYQSVTYWGDFA